jgi:hypothetical protein
VKLQRVFSVTTLIVIILGLISSFGSEVQIPTLKERSATKLVIVYERIHIGVDDPTEITMRAVNDEGIIDTSRDDLLQLNVTPFSHLTCRAELSAYTLRLQNGTATAVLVGEAMEMVKLTVTWKDGKSELKSNTITIQIGNFEG